MELHFDHTTRGFARYDFKDLYGEACSLQASSLATDEAIWFGCNEAKVHSTTGQPIAPRMHLNREQVAVLLPILKHFVMTGEVSDQPAKDLYAALES
jgi:hypothetical protein